MGKPSWFSPFIDLMDAMVSEKTEGGRNALVELNWTELNGWQRGAWQCSPSSTIKKYLEITNWDREKLIISQFIHWRQHVFVGRVGRIDTSEEAPRPTLPNFDPDPNVTEESYLHWQKHSSPKILTDEGRMIVSKTSLKNAFFSIRDNLDPDSIVIEASVCNLKSIPCLRLQSMQEEWLQPSKSNRIPTLQFVAISILIQMLPRKVICKKKTTTHSKI
jgi:hypothetical protein